MAPPRRVAALCALALAVALAGCAALPGADGDDGPDVDPDEYDADELRAESVATMAEVDSYATEVEQSIAVEYTSPDAETTNYTLAVNASGRTDETREATRLQLDTTIQTPTRSLPVGGEGIHVGDRAYLLDDDWVLQSEDAAWSPLAQDLAVLENASVEVEGAATVGGEPALRLAVEPRDSETLEGYGLDRNVSADPRPARTDVQSTTVVAYVSPEAPHYLLRTDVEVAATAQDADFVTTSTVRYHELDADVAVDVPDGLPTGNEST